LEIETELLRVEGYILAQIQALGDLYPEKLVESDPAIRRTNNTITSKAAI
jgi:hypothetical protein